MPDSPIQVLPVTELQPNPFQPREKVKKEDLEELIQSIKIYGVLEPLVVASTPAGYQIIAGERRWRAAQAAGLTEVPVHIKKTTPKGMLEMALVENVQRIDLNPIERAQAFQQLMREFGLSNAELATRVGKSAPYVSNSLKLLELPDALTDGLLGGEISEGHARAIAGIGDEKLILECYKQVLKEGASVRRTEELARRYKEVTQHDAAVKPGRPLNHSDEDVEKWQQQLQSRLVSPTQLKLIRTRNQTRLTITLKGPPAATQSDIEKLLMFQQLDK